MFSVWVNASYWIMWWWINTESQVIPPVMPSFLAIGSNSPTEWKMTKCVYMCVRMWICVCLCKLLSKPPRCLRYSLSKRVRFLSERGRVAPVRNAEKEGKNRWEKGTSGKKRAYNLGYTENRRERDRNEKKGSEKLCKYNREDQGHTWRGAHFSSVVYSYYPGFRAPWKDRIAFQQGLSVVAAPPSIQTPGTPLHPDGQGWKTNRGDMGTRGKAMYGRWEPHRQAICHDEEAPFPVPPRTQHVLLHPLQAPLRSIAMPCQLTDPTPATLIRTLILPSFSSQAFTVSPGSVPPHHMENWSRDGFHLREIDGSHVWIGVECNLWFTWSSADLSVAPVRIRCCAQAMLKAARVAVVYSTSLLAPEMSLCWTYLLVQWGW